VDELTGVSLLSQYLRSKKLKDLVVVATDIGISKRARDVALKLDASLAIVEKRRLGNNDSTEALNVIGDVNGKTALTVDDEIDTAGSLVGVVDTLLQRGAREVYACATHPVLSGKAVERIQNSPVKELVVTDTIPLNGAKKLDKITVLSMSALLGEAIHRIHTGLSVGAMFE
jgi:ribose-phosphate pyrophosphokinase